MVHHVASYEWNKYKILVFHEISMKIGIDIRLWNQTGVGRYERNLVFNLLRVDSKNEYILFFIPEDLSSIKDQIRNFKNLKLVQADIKWHSIDEQFKFINVLNEENLDIVHFPYYSIPVFYKKPFVVTIHDLIPLHFQTGNASTLPFPLYKFKFMAYKFIVSKAVRNARAIIAPSKFSKEEIIKFLKSNPSKIHVVYEGVDEYLKNKDDSERNKKHFLYIGNAYPHKNLELLVDVFKKLPESKLILVGKEDYFYRRLKKKAEGLENIVFFKEASDKQLSYLYREAKALIIPSFIEGFGLPALEAMANKCLVLASDIPVLHEVGGEASLYFNPKDENSLIDLINRVNYGEFNKNINSGFERASKFNWEKTAGETLKIYESSNSLRQS